MGCKVLSRPNRNNQPGLRRMTMTDMTFAFANHYGYTDVNPFEIVRHVSPTTIAVRAMSAVRANPGVDMGFAPGGFVGHFVDQHLQEWIITPCPENPVVRIRRSKAKRKAGKWYSKNGERFVLAAAPRKFYDFNF